MGRPLEVAGLLALLGAAVACQPSGVVAGSSSGGEVGSSGSANSGTGSSTGSALGTSSGSGSSGGASSGSASGASAGGSSTGGPIDFLDAGPGCIDQPPDGGCWVNEPDGGPCVTVADCAPGLVCNYGGDCYSGSCLPPPPAATLACTPVGQSCGDSAPACCAGECSGGSCVPWTACGEAGSACQTDLDCCSNFACQSGSCQGTCGLEYQPCQSSNDCCLNQGLSCTEVQGIGVDTAICYPGSPFPQAYDDQGDPILCGAAACSTWQCQVGAACAVVGGVDPCLAAGEICDATFDVCRAPESDSSAYLNWNSPLIADECIPGAEPCQGIPDSTVQPACVFMPDYDAGFCLQPCATTADCVSAFDLCVPYGDGGEGYCHYWDSCSNYFDACNASDVGDGLCIPEDFGFGLTGFCTQAVLEGGSAGARVLSSGKGNRQNGSLCDTQDLPNGYGLCEPACNAGTAGVDAGPGCPSGQSCFGWFGSTLQLPYPEEVGTCSPSCDFTAADGGGCPLDQDGIQEKCLPQFLLGYPDAPLGFCIAGAAEPVAVNQVCPYSFDGQIGVPLDPCIAGTLCLGVNVLTTLRTCTQMCNRVGQSAGCPSGQSCQPFIVEEGAPNPTRSGYCE